MPNPIVIELTRGRLIESAHAGAMAVARADGRPLAAIGDVRRPIFPRSTLKPLQALAFVESGAADRFGFAAPEIAVACASHSGTQRHVALVSSMLERAGLTSSALACGAHVPMDAEAARELIVAGAAPSPLHHNCSGKHAAMLATAAHFGEPAEGYWRPDHPVQKRIARIVAEMTDYHLSEEVRGIDGCSVPNWAIPLQNLAAAFARLATGSGMEAARAEHCRRIAAACWAHPVLAAGPMRLEARLLESLRHKVLLKSGAEGVYCGAFPDFGLGFALKIDDGAPRAAEAVVSHLVASVFPQAAGEPAAELRNWRGLRVGEIRPSAELRTVLDELRTWSSRERPAS
jgi:L-asparaginase II